MRHPLHARTSDPAVRRIVRASLTLALGALVAGLVPALATGATAAQAAPTFAPHASFAPGRVLVQFRAGSSPGKRAELLTGLHAVTVHAIKDLGIDVLRVPAGAEQHVVDALQRSGKVTFAQRDGVVQAQDIVPNDPYWANQWGANKVGAPNAWTTTTGASSVVVAVLDTGLDPSLSEFAGRVLPGYNFIGNNTNVTDDNSHGTAVTGIIAAKGNNATGVAGMCWSCSILPVKVLDANAVGTDSAVASGITWAADHGARVINLSLGSATQSTAQAKAVSYAQSKGVLVVAAAGNNGSSAPFYPADDPGVVSVAASDQLDRLYSYSDYGGWVSVAAPGSGYSVWPGGNCYNFSGTSAASPVIAGLAGLLMSAAPTASAGQVSAAITQTTDPLTAGSVSTGRVDAAKAMAALTGATSSNSPSPSPTGSTASSTPTASPTSSSASPTPSPSPSPSPSSSATPTPSPTRTSSSPPKHHK